MQNKQQKFVENLNVDINSRYTKINFTENEIYDVP